MSAGRPSQRPAPDWLASEVEQSGLQRYFATILDRWWLVLGCILLSAGAAVAYVQTAEKVYEASADLLVTPVAGGDSTTLGLGLIRESNDPTRDVSTAARYVQSVQVARNVRARLRLADSPRKLLGKVSAEPVAQSSLVAVTAKADTPRGAARLANAFAEETVRERTTQLRRQLELTIPALRRRLAELPPEERAAPGGIATRLGGLEALRGVADPTIRVVAAATAPETQSAPRPMLSLAAGLLAGLLLGLGGAFGLQAIDPRLRREEQLRERYRVPVLARIPAEPRTRRRTALAPDALSPGTFEAYRTLRASLTAAMVNDLRSGSVLVTGSSPGEGKTTTAINLAHALVAAGNRVILIEADVHRPQVGAALGLRPRFGLSAVLIRQVPLQEALLTTERYGPDLQFLLVDRPGPATADRLSLPTARQLVQEAQELADYVIVDSAPLTEVIDALPLAQQVSAVLVVARMNKTKLRRLTDLGEILAQNHIQPAGVALIGVERTRSGYYAAGAQAEEREGREAPLVG